MKRPRRGAFNLSLRVGKCRISAPGPCCPLVFLTYNFDFPIYLAGLLYRVLIAASARARARSSHSHSVVASSSEFQRLSQSEEGGLL